MLRFYAFPVALILWLTVQTGHTAIAREDQSPGMARSQIALFSAGLSVVDTPLHHLTPVGPEMDFRISYSSAEASEPIASAFSNFGPGWKFNWLSYLTVDGAKNVTVTTRSGDAELFRFKLSDNGKGSYRHALSSHAALTTSDSNVFERKLPDGSVEVYDLQDGTGRVFMSKVIDPAGNTAKIKYDENFRIQSVADASGQETKFKHLSDSQDDIGYYKISRVTDPFGRSANFTYSSDGTHLLSSADSVGLVSEYKYAAGSYAVNAICTPYGTTRFEHYVPNGSPPKSSGMRTTFPNGQKSVVEHWAGAVRETYKWDRHAMEMYPSDPANGDHSHAVITRWLSTSNGTELPVLHFVKPPLENRLVASYESLSDKEFDIASDQPVAMSKEVPVSNQDGTVSSAEQKSCFEYNSFGKVLKEVDPIGRTLIYRYADNGIDLLEARLKRGEKTELLSKWEYKKEHLPSSYVDGSGQCTRYEYNEFGQLTKLIDAENNVFVANYDSKGYLTDIAYPGIGTTQKFAYDNCGRRRTETDSNGISKTFSYDQADRLTEIAYADGTVERVKYDKLDAVSFTDRTGKETKRTYDSMDQIASLEDPLGRKTHYKWCSCGNLLELKDPAGNVTSWHHDLEGRTIEKTFANKTKITYEYEKDGNRLHSKTDASGQVTVYAYNLDDTISQLSYRNAANPTSAVTMKYDPARRVLSSITNDFGSIKYTHYPFVADEKQHTTGAGEIATIENTGIANSVITFKYDRLGRVANRSINGSGNSTEVSFDQLGRVVSEKNNLGEFTWRYEKGDAATARTSAVHYPNGLNVNFAFDREQYLQSIQVLGKNPSPISQFQYRFDPSGLLTTWSETFGDKSRVSKFAYDGAGQLETVSIADDGKSLPAPAYQYQYQYDIAANRKLSKDNLTTSQAGFDSMNQLVSIVAQTAREPGPSTSSTTNLTYDANGNLSSDGTSSYRWDAENRLVQIERPQGSIRFVYNAVGECSKIIESQKDTAEVSRYLVWGNNRVCEVRDANNAIEKQLFPLGEKGPGGKRFFAIDHLGSTRLVTDEAGAVLARLDYDPLGKMRLAHGSEHPSTQYAGYFTHEATGLNLTLFRSYSSELGRWLTRDPSGEFGLAGQPEWPIAFGKFEVLATNLYAYAGNNSVQFTDPLGLQQQQQWGYNPNQSMLNGGGGNGGGSWGAAAPGHSIAGNANQIPGGSGGQVHTTYNSNMGQNFGTNTNNAGNTGMLNGPAAGPTTYNNFANQGNLPGSMANNGLGPAATRGFPQGPNTNNGSNQAPSNWKDFNKPKPKEKSWLDQLLGGSCNK